jgi:hypothetical protein
MGFSQAGSPAACLRAVSLLGAGLYAADFEADLARPAWEQFLRRLTRCPVRLRPPRPASPMAANRVQRRA